MEEKAMDRRVRKTRESLITALITLLEKKNINEISVRELSELADINRGTFYLHYKDPYDMLKKIEEEMLATLTELLQRYPAQDIKDDPLVILTALYEYITSQPGLLRLLLGPNGDISFLAALNEVVRVCCINNWMAVFQKKEAKIYDYFCSFIVSGCVALVSDWLNSGMKESPEEMAHLSRDIIRNGIGILS